MKRPLETASLFFFLLCSPAFGEEQYACFRQGVDDPNPLKLSIKEAEVSWVGTIGANWELHEDGDFCDASYQHFSSETGYLVATCFSKKEMSLFEARSSFGDPVITIPATYRCIAVN
jgi:hypothetical protein